MAIPRLYTLEESNLDLLGLLEQLIRSVEKQLAAVIRMAFELPLGTAGRIIGH